MTLERWAGNGWLKPHQTTPQEIQGQLAAAARDLIDAGKNLSPDWQFAIAYNAALRLCSVVLFASGFEAVREQKHYRTIGALPLVLGSDAEDTMAYLDRCRVKRSEVTYESAGAISKGEAVELIGEVDELTVRVTEWLQRRHPKMLDADQG